MGKKNLDKLFQEKLKDFPEVPDEKVWQSIEASLNKKKKSRKVIPIWWRLGGVAAVLLIAFTFINPFSSNTGTIPVVTDVEVDTEKTSEEQKENETFKNQNLNEDQVVDVNQETITNSVSSATNEVANTTGTTQEGTKTSSVQKSSKQERFTTQNAIEVQVAETNTINTKKAIEKKEENVVSEKAFDRITNETEITESASSKAEVEKNLSKEGVNTLDIGPLNKKDSSLKEGIAENKKEEVSEDIEKPKKKSIFDEVAKQQQEDEAVVENTGSKWSAGLSVAPVYFNAMGEGSPVHSIFVPNSKSGDVNLSYGLSVAYEVSKKLSIKSGIHKVDYGYRTNDIEFSSSLENATTSQIDNIDYTVTARSLVVSSKASTRVEAFNQNPFLNTNSLDVTAESAPRDGVMEQQFGYLEVPIELNYALLDKRFGINIIGGVSSLFLVDNSIALSSGELTTDVGEANNINAVNFSTNVGFGVNYKVTPKVQLNIEPVFKYQLNTFSETDGTFNPFSVGVYSGLSFRF